MAQESNQVSPTSLTASEIRAQIERTRAEMSQTIDSIQERLSPARLMSEAKQSVKDATVGRVKRIAATMTMSADADRPFDGERVVHAVRTNPLPYAIAGVAATALMARAMIRSRRRSRLNLHRSAAPSVQRPRPLANRFLGDKRRLLVSGCAAGLGCWSAWRARNAGRSDTLNPAV
jgi:hypothetical protein